MKVKVALFNHSNTFVELDAHPVPTPKFSRGIWEPVTRTNDGEGIIGKLSVTKGGYFKRVGQWYRVNLRDERLDY